MRTGDFQEQLRESGAYETPASPRRSVSDRLFGWADTWYYLRMAAIVIRAFIKVRRHRYDRRAWAASSFDVLQLVEGSGARVSILDALPVARQRGPIVFVANHMSVLETFLLPVILLAFNDVSVVVKENLLRYPFLGAILRAVECISVGRRNVRDDLREMMDKGVAALTRGRSVLVFPQSTRTATIAPSDFNTIGVKLARRAGVPVVPIALKTDFQGIGRLVRDVGPIRRDRPVRLRFGPPLWIREQGREEHGMTVSFIAESLASWGGNVPGSVVSDEGRQGRRSSQ